MKQCAFSPRLFSASLAFAGLLFSAGCSKSDGPAPTPNNTGKLTCKINGTRYQFNSLVSGNDRPSEPTVHFVTVSGHETSDINSPGFGFQLVHDDVKVGTYSTAGSELHGEYYWQNYANGQFQGTTVYDGDGSDGTSFVMNLTSLDNWGVKGTFSGVLKLVAGSTTLTVTDGVFEAPYN